MNTFLGALMVTLVIILIALIAALIYSGFNEGMGEDGLSENIAIVKHKEIDTVTTMMMVGKVMVPQTTTYHYVSVTLDEVLRKIDVPEEQYNSIVVGDSVYVGYVIGYFDHRKYYNSVFKTEALR